MGAKDDTLGIAQSARMLSLADDAAHGLARRMPALSAHRVITVRQAIVLTATAITFAGFAILAPHVGWTALVVVTSGAFLAGTLFRAVLACVGGLPGHHERGTVGELPVYTILVPLYREANVLPRLARALLLLDYPHDKLDIKLIVEADDPHTLAVADALVGRGPFDVICVPTVGPRTKPKACNFALHFARGEFTVIFDAEDRPERDQLRKAVAAFRTLPARVACLQARLNFYNADENWLTRLFALDYALWFDVLLPGLDRIGVPMPLGGTSNHFRTAVLRELGGWDPFNVTEDADLGIRIAQLGNRVAMLDSTTFEEAPTRLDVWLKQRSRWLKGYMQTWLVHTREPFGLVRRAGIGGFFAFHLFIGGSVAASLANPLLWVLFGLSLMLPHGGASSMTALASLIGGNALLSVLATIGSLRRGWRDLAPYGLTVTLYWALISLAAWRGLKQLITDPFHWEKTAHGLSRRRAG
ncbi:MAG TPA: glycosyltransferase [Rhizomicrobium sp.]|nr:glycosyltransferase [Rhizomicrobium sp.]